MIRDDIIKMAREAGFVVDEKAQQHQPNCIFHTHHMVDELLERFAALVRADEREQCAKVFDPNETDDAMDQIVKAKCAAAIRSRT